MNKDLGRNPSVIANQNALCDKRKSRAFIVMGSRAKMATLRNNNPLAQKNFPLRVKCHPVGTTTFVSNFQIPWGPNFHARINMHTMAYFCTEKP
jgi:hypothetical protein